MNTSNLARMFTGISIIVLGLAALLGGFNLYDFGDIFRHWWPTLVVVAGFLSLLNNPRQLLWPLILIVLGLFWQLNTLNVVDINVWQLVVPAIVIAIGWSVIRGQSGAPKQLVNHQETDSASALLGGAATKNESSDYTGGKVSAVLGGVSLDLRHAVIKKSATLDIFALMGGVEIRVPEGWSVRSHVTPILGGVENKTSASSKKGAPVLHITGTAIFGGVEVKH